ncbi:cytosine deaminase [Stenotrophomonas maltophilia]|nr:cytosine deaminase [Stenotrophomonas maltophilia]
MTALHVHGAVDAAGQPLSFTIEHGRFTRFAASGAPEAGAGEGVDLRGYTVLPALVDGHIHLDKSFVGDHWRPHQPVASLRERLAQEKQALADAAPMDVRAEALMRQIVALGTAAVRCHVDVDATTGLRNLHAVQQAHARCADLLDIQYVAFPQAGVMSCAGTAQVLRQAVAEGVQVVGGIDPQGLDGDANGQLDLLFDLADRHAARIDVHLHEPGEQGLAQLLQVCARTEAAGLQGRVAVSHAYALGEVPLARAQQVGEALARAQVAIMTNAPGDRPFPPVAALHAQGVRLFSGNDNIRDSWWPYGNGDLLQRAMLIGYRSGFHTDAKLQLTTHAAAVLGLPDHGLQEGLPATFVAVRADHGPAAVAGVPSDRVSMRRGRWILPPRIA